MFGFLYKCLENATKPSTSKSGSSSQGRNLWVSGLSQQTRATDLKQLFTKFGKVVGAKVVTNTRTPGTRCYGYVTMASVKDATECIENLHRTELHGRLISVERAKSDLGPPKSTSVVLNSKDEKRCRSSGYSKKTERLKQAAKDNIDNCKKLNKEKGKSNDNKIHKEAEEGKTDEQKTTTTIMENQQGQTNDVKEVVEVTKTISHHRHKSSSSKKDDIHRSRSNKYRRDNENKSNRKSRSRSHEILSFEKIREERERQRLRQKERELREEERRRREIARRQRDEENRLTREREKLALERARIEKEKVELLRLERERQKLEREKIELERLELKRQQRKYGFINFNNSKV